jgi:plasmid stability protein
VSQLIVRNVDPSLVRALKRCAAGNGRSAEAEHREILRRALGAETGAEAFKALLASMPDVGTDEELAPARDLPRPLP